MWDLENEENYILHLDGHTGYDPNEKISCLAYCDKKGTPNNGRFLELRDFILNSFFKGCDSSF